MTRVLLVIHVVLVVFVVAVAVAVAVAVVVAVAVAVGRAGLTVAMGRGIVRRIRSRGTPMTLYFKVQERSKKKQSFGIWICGLEGRQVYTWRLIRFYASGLQPQNPKKNQLKR